MRKEEIFFDAITGLREELVEEAQNHRPRRRVRWERWAGLAACLALAAFLSLPFLRLGGGSGSDSNTSDTSGAPSAADQAAPEDAPSGETAPQDPAARPGGDSGPAPGDLFQFTATVLEVRETGLLVAPEAESGIAVQAVVPTEGLDGLPDLREGDRVSITCAGILETEPARIMGVADVALLAE